MGQFLAFRTADFRFSCPQVTSEFCRHCEREPTGATAKMQERLSGRTVVSGRLMSAVRSSYPNALLTYTAITRRGELRLQPHATKLAQLGFVVCSGFTRF